MLVIGDLSFYHDLNGLLAAQLHDLDATVVLVNNDGGGIFSFLPQGDAGVSRGATSSSSSARRTASTSPTPRRSTAPACRAPTTGRPSAPRSPPRSPRRGCDVIEMRTDRARNVEHHRAVWAAVRAAVEEAL